MTPAAHAGRTPHDASASEHTTVARAKAAGTNASTGKHARGKPGGVSVLDLIDKVGGPAPLAKVNAGGGKTNCVMCVVTTDRALDGIRASAVLGGPRKISELESHFNAKFAPVGGRNEIESKMKQAGPGARGVVFGSRGEAVGHVFNVINDRGKVRFLDGQTGKEASFNGGYKSFQLMRYR